MRKFLRLVVHIGCLAPLAFLIKDYYSGGLTVNPIQAATLRTGRTALNLLVLTLACSPANTYLGFRPALQARRALGLYAFFYASLHFMIFIGLDYGFNLRLIWLEFDQKRYILAGAGALLLLTPLAVTSFNLWKRRLGKNWKHLHQLVYLAALLAVTHYLWEVKTDIRPPLAYGAVVLLLLLLRIRIIEKPLLILRLRWMYRLRKGGKTWLEL